jgi:hypothetical protein
MHYIHYGVGYGVASASATLVPGISRVSLAFEKVEITHERYTMVNITVTRG